MGPLASMLSAILLTDIGVTVKRIKRNSLFGAFIAVLALTAYVFALVAGTLYLATIYNGLTAALIMAGGSLFLVLVLVGIMYAMEARDRRIAIERKRKSQLQTNIAVATALTLLRKKPLLAAGLAVGVGAALSFLKRTDDD